jgi:LmbE family N-acetylglucosaminyl deacetylase
VIAAHPDDETIGCLGAILGHSSCGDQVKVLMITDGSGSRAGGLQPQQMAAQRRREVVAIRQLLAGVEIEECGLVEGNWSEGTGAAILSDALEWQPMIVYASSCVDFHPEHLKVARVLGKVAGTARSDFLIRCYEVHVPLGPELLNRYAPLDVHTVRRKAEAVNTYRSQGEALQQWKRESRYVGALVRAGCRAEGFWELDAEAYSQVMAYGKWGWPETPFGSLTGRPLRDLEAYIKGDNVRRKLQSIASSRMSGS